MRFLSDRDLVDLLPPHTLIQVIEQSLRDFADHRVTVPRRQHTHFGDNVLLTMPVIGSQAFGAKIVSVVPSNSTRGLPVTQGLMTLSDGVTGRPLAVLEAAMLTAQRTGAVGALGLKYTTPPNVDRIGVIGTGVQGTWQAIFACAVRPVRTIYFVARSDETARRFAGVVSRHVPAVRLARCGDVKELLSNTQVVIAATTSNDPVLPRDGDLLGKKHFVSIGSFKPSMQELPDSVYALAGEVVVDSDAAKDEVGDLIEPLASGLIRQENIVHIADLVVGKRSIDTARSTVFKSVGLALYDLYAAQAFCAEALRLGRGTLLNIQRETPQL
jgi:ornithine cyclodeaminase/alanine dehydrogenase-like protein (mu-crystallin family)